MKTVSQQQQHSGSFSSGLGVPSHSQNTFKQSKSQQQQQQHQSKASPSISQEQDSKYQYIQSKDRYVGDIDPVTKLRHGQGVYTYDNAYFQYKGAYENGQKQGHGVLLMRDGSRYEGEFQNGEITGKGERTYPDGTVYQGEFNQGEKHGYGEIRYGKFGEWYKGEWNMNVRSGQGTLFNKEKNTFTGDFKEHWPNGICTILYNDGSHYHGEVQRGIKHGQGKLSQPAPEASLNTLLDHNHDINVVYDGAFDYGQKHGRGRLYVENGAFSLDSKFICDQPEYEANQLVLRLPHKPEEEEVKIDPKAKKPDPKAAAQAKPEEDKDANKHKINYEIGKEGNTIEFELHVIYQGPSYEDPNPPPVEETKAAPAKGGKGAKPVEEVKPEIRMITPDPVLMAHENGRTFEFELGRMEKVKRNEESQAALEHQPSQDQPAAELEEENKWVTYKFNQQLDTLKQRINSVEGVCKVSNLNYALDEHFRGGQYEIMIKDVTVGILPEKRLQDIKIELNIIDPEELAAQQAALAAQSKAPAKKK